MLAILIARLTASLPEKLEAQISQVPHCGVTCRPDGTVGRCGPVWNIRPSPGSTAAGSNRGAPGASPASHGVWAWAGHASPTAANIPSRIQIRTFIMASFECGTCTGGDGTKAI